MLAAHRARSPAVTLTLVQGLPKGAKMDDVVRMGTELGIAAFVPVLTERSVGRPSAERVGRWRRIAAAAAKQSGRGHLSRVDDVVRLDAVWERLGGHLLLVPWEGEASVPIGRVLAGLDPQDRHRPVAIVVGPEGGFSEREVADARHRDAHVVSLGPLILRTETAGLVTAAMVLYELTLRPPPGARWAGAG